MKEALRYILPAWLVSIVLPLPAIVFRRSDYGGAIALGLFFIGCANVVASAFRQEVVQGMAGGNEQPQRIWRSRMRALATALIAAYAIFSLLWLILSGTRDVVPVALGLLILIPSLCVVPHFTLLTGRRIAAVVFTLIAVFCMKLLGCVVVVLVYGWHADAQDPPYTDMPWTQPNLLVWLFWLFTAVLSLSFYFLGKRRFCRVYGRAANHSLHATAAAPGD